MNRPFLIAVMVFFSLNLRSQAQPYSTQPADAVVTGVVRVADHVKLPAKEAGVLSHLGVKEGSQVRAGQQIGKIDDREIQLQMEAAEHALRAAVKRYNDDIDIQYAKAGADVAKEDYLELQETNALADKAITDVDLRRAKLEWRKMELGGEKAIKEQEIAKYEAYMKQAELKLAKLAIERRNIVAPFDGVVEEMSRKQDEWVNPGDTILRLFRMDTMQVEGAVEQKLYDPHELQGCKVTVEVQMARGRKEIVEGQITKVSSIIRGDGFYNVRAEVANKQEYGGGWMLRDGLPATMTIHLGTGGSAAAGVSRAP